MATPNAVPDLKHDYYDIKTYKETANFLHSNLPSSLQQPKVAIICGSGLGGLAETLAEPTVTFDYKVWRSFPLLSCSLDAVICGMEYPMSCHDIYIS